MINDRSEVESSSSLGGSCESFLRELQDCQSLVVCDTANVGL